MNHTETLLRMICGNRHLSYFYKYLNRSFSQEGEDLILRRVFKNRREGFYVDIGAHHPFRFSNTYYFYEIGWRGINIDPAPYSMRLFRRFRERDINLEVAVGKDRGKKRYFVFNEPALNTFDENLARSRDGVEGFKIIDIVEIEVFTLKEILDNYLPLETKIDFMNVDVEGMDLEVLQSNDWSKYKPYVVLVEILNKDSIDEVLKDPIYSFMYENGYKLFAKTFNTCFFISENELIYTKGKNIER